MKEKKDFKDAFYNTLIIIVSFLLVMSINKQCSSAMQKMATAKIEKIQKSKNYTNVLQKIR